MRKSSGILLAACLLAATPAMAGNLTFDKDKSTWHSSTCTKPIPPESVITADPETKGNVMNAMVARFNVYAGQAQAYMNCISNEAENDQKVTNDAITSGAQAEIASVKVEIERMAAPIRGAQQE